LAVGILSYEGTARHIYDSERLVKVGNVKKVYLPACICSKEVKAS